MVTAIAAFVILILAALLFGKAAWAATKLFYRLRGRPNWPGDR
jgi:hypothetical protein